MPKKRRGGPLLPNPQKEGLPELLSRLRTPPKVKKWLFRKEIRMAKRASTNLSPRREGKGRRPRGRGTRKGEEKVRLSEKKERGHRLETATEEKKMLKTRLRSHQTRGREKIWPHQLPLKRSSAEDPEKKGCL